MKTPTTRTLTIKDFNPNGRLTKASYAFLLWLKGCWVKDVGFHVGGSSQGHNPSPGIIELRVCSPVQIDASFFTAINRLNAVLK